MVDIFSLQGKSPVGGAIGALVASVSPDLFVVQISREYMGHSYDPVTRRVYFSACVLIDSVATGTFYDKINNTVYTIYVGDGLFDITVNGAPFSAHAFGPGDTYDGKYALNFYLCYLDIDTFAVTMIDTFDPAATIPNGVGVAPAISDGTYRMTVCSDIAVDQQFKLADPRTADVWTHMSSPDCNIYVFRAGDGYKQQLLPFVAINHMELLGTTSDWTLVMASTTTARNNGSLYTVPRLTTADETAVASLLGYFVAVQPAWMNTAYYRTALSPSDKLYFFGSTRSGTRDYRLYEYVPPPAIGPYMGSAQPGGTFTDITPWAAGTGPNTNVAAYTFDQINTSANTNKILRWPRHSILSLPATGELALLSILGPQNTTVGGANNDPADFRIDCTYYDIAGTTFDYQEGFIIGYMKADWTSAAGVGDAAFAVQFMREIDTFREMHAYDYGDDYTIRWLFFTVQPVVGGMFTWDSTGASNLTVMAKYQFISGAPPVLLDFKTDDQWLPFYATYAAAIGNDNVVEQSVKMTGELTVTGGPFGSAESYLTENGFHDGDVFWFGGGNLNSILINAALPAYRGYGTIPFTPASDAFVRLSFADVPPPPVSTDSVWFALMGPARPRS